MSPRHIKRRIVLPFAGPIEATDHVLGHELVHAFQYDITNTNVSSGNVGALALAALVHRGHGRIPVDRTGRSRIRRCGCAKRRDAKSCRTIDDLDDPQVLPLSLRPGGLGVHRRAVTATRWWGTCCAPGPDANGGYKQAIESVLGGQDRRSCQRNGTPPFSRRTVRSPRPRKMPGAIARGVIPRKKGQRTERQPGVEPGRHARSSSSRSAILFSIDLFVADARTGKIIRKITNTATDPTSRACSSCLRPAHGITSGKRFVFPGISKGQPVLTIVDVDRGRTEREIRLEDARRGAQPRVVAGRTHVAFSALVGGFNDLFVYDLEADKLRRLTNDAFAELDPAWSPDGRRLAFATDRFTTELDEHRRRQAARCGHGRRRQGTCAGRRVRRRARTSARSGRPMAERCIFLSDRQGVTNIYRTDDWRRHDSGDESLTGVSGITALSPATVGCAKDGSSSARTKTTAIRSTRSSRRSSSPERPPVRLPLNAAILPPRRTAEGPVYALLSDPKTRVAAAGDRRGSRQKTTSRSWGSTSRGSPRSPLAWIRLGPMRPVAIGMVFSDMLGNHTLMTGVQVDESSRRVRWNAVLHESGKRWNWGAMIDQTPYVARGFEAGFDDEQWAAGVRRARVARSCRPIGRPPGIISYPFSRAQRVDALAGSGRSVSSRTRERFFSSDERVSSSAKRPPTSVRAVRSISAKRRPRSSTTRRSAVSQARFAAAVTASSSRRAPARCTYTGVLGDFRTYLHARSSVHDCAPRHVLRAPSAATRRTSDCPFSMSGIQGSCAVTIPALSNRSSAASAANGQCPAFDR